MATFCTRTSCEAKVKVSLAQCGAAASGWLRGEFSEGTDSVLIRREKNLQLDNSPAVLLSTSSALLNSPQ